MHIWPTRGFLKRMRDQKGFSLLEIIVAIAILSVGILAAGSLQGPACKNNVISRNYTEASTIATDRIEKLMVLDWDDTLLSDTDNDGTNGGGLDDTGTGADHSAVDGKYTIYWNVSADDFPVPDTKTVREIVMWNNRGTQARISMDRIVPKII